MIVSYDILQREEEIITTFVESVMKNKSQASQQPPPEYNTPVIYCDTDNLHGSKFTIAKRKFETSGGIGLQQQTGTTLSSLASYVASMNAKGSYSPKPDEPSSDSSLDSVDGGSDDMDGIFEPPCVLCSLASVALPVDFYVECIANMRKPCAQIRKRRNNGDKVRKPGAPKTSMYRGVSLRNGKWVARITENGSQKYLGYYSTEKEAGLSYNAAALRIHGDHAILNEIDMT